ncbi:phosphatase PAP2 family protein [Chitinophaga niabensis]|uniref:Membrane-associated phospholipid phosphatase n=1 Tax=Chitinophaga niabensis TaxID=536979 RepID=A0A1N6J4M2_9BACT|nr:phosphatase PAP2 family protein [Chitinophaga niabensis]SIO39274.1 Membrane-associated phospholipid phosphatase [Chitinophaga niabensis]
MLKTLATLVAKNRYFFIPFLLWLIIGGALLTIFTKDQLFLAVNGAHNPVADILVTISTYVGNGLLFGLILAFFLFKRQWRNFFMGAAAFLLVTLIVQFLKRAFSEPRPISYFTDPTVLHILPWISVHSGLSFPSGHTSTAFAMYCFITLMWSNKKMGWVLFLLALSTAHSRLYLSQHFFSDVYVGSIIGTFCCTLVYWLFEYRKSQTPGTTCIHNTVITPSAGNI